MAVPPRHLAFDDNTTLGLRNADYEGWKGALGGLADLPRVEGPAADDLAALNRTLAAWGQLERAVTAQERQTARFWRPGPMALVALLAAVAFAAVGAWMRWLWLFRLAPPALAAGMILAGANWIARRILDRRRALDALRAEALATVERIAGRTFLTVAGSTVIEGRGYRTRFRQLDEEAEGSLKLATEKIREVDSTLAHIRSANQRLGRDADDAQTLALAGLRQRLQSELRGLQIARAELTSRRARLDARFAELAALAEREALSARATTLLESRRTPDPLGPPAPTDREALDAGLVELRHQVEALESVLTGARGRVDATVEASATRIDQLLTRTT